jgi:SAM-dependent methyltransferase
VAASADELRWSEGVHAPSDFSRLLVDSAPDPRDRACVDAGCGAGLVTVSLLQRGAASVFAFDKDRYAVADARANVARLAPDPRRARFRIGGFAELSGEPCDMLLCNPPQRPRALWEDLERPAQRPHFVAGDDGLGAVRLVLMLTSAPCAIFSLSTIVCPDAAPIAAEFGREAHLLGERVVQHDAVWRRIAEDLRMPARVWELRASRTSGGPTP